MPYYWKVEMELPPLYLLSIYVNPTNISKLLLHYKPPKKKTKLNGIKQQPFHSGFSKLSEFDRDYLLVKFTLQEASPGFLTWKIPKQERKSPSLQELSKPLLVSCFLESHYQKQITLLSSYSRMEKYILPIDERIH